MALRRSSQESSVHPRANSPEEYVHETRRRSRLSHDFGDVLPLPEISSNAEEVEFHLNELEPPMYSSEIKYQHCAIGLPDSSYSISPSSSSSAAAPASSEVINTRNGNDFITDLPDLSFPSVDSLPELNLPEPSYPLPEPAIPCTTAPQEYCSSNSDIVIVSLDSQPNTETEAMENLSYVLQAPHSTFIPDESVYTSPKSTISETQKLSSSRRKSYTNSQVLDAFIAALNPRKSRVDEVKSRILEWIPSATSAEKFFVDERLHGFIHQEENVMNITRHSRFQQFSEFLKTQARQARRKFRDSQRKRFAKQRQSLKNST